METVRKIAAVLIFPVLAGLVACNGEGPTGPGGGTTGIPGGGGARTRWVNDDGVPVPPGSGCGNPGYRTIQEAVEAALPGDKIKVCAGLYVEQVKVRPGKDNIQLISVGRWKAVIQAPEVMMPDEGDVTKRSIVRVSAQNVTVLAFTIKGPGTGCQLNYGVRVDNNSANSGAAQILGNHITKIKDVSGACGQGVAVIVGPQAPASAQILGNVIDDYEANGPTVMNGSTAEISYNRVLGRGPSSPINQNGIQVGDASSATVRHNFVALNNGGFGTGMFFFGGARVTSEHNTITANDYGAYHFETAIGSSVTESRIRANNYDGIVLAAANGNQVTHNASEHNALSGVFLWFDAGQIQSNHIVRDQIQDNAFGGILLDGANNNEVRANHVKDNGTETENPDVTDGIRINSGSGNVLTDNHLKRNVTHDCHDETGGVANTWTNNRAGTSFPPGLCGNDDDEGEDLSIFGWDPNYPWYTSFEEAVNLDWALGYAEFDLDSILALLPTIRLDLFTRPKPSPHQ